MLRKVYLENGAVEGLPAADPRITSFKGIPFAAPPVGENRWRAPQPAKDWDGVLKAYKFAPISMQRIPGRDPDSIYSREWNVDPTIEMSEDCLMLNVWTPADSTDEKLPVFVWFFGGGLQEGNTAEMEFDGERIARRGIVVVTVNYRVNVFGFFAHPEITRESPEAPANFGYLDQRYGIMWVKRNISAFGGDPDNITIGGQSSGGGSVMAQIASPMNRGLFQRAIVDSGLELCPYVPSFFSLNKPLKEAEKAGEDFFKILGVKTLSEARKLDPFYIRDKMDENGLRFSVVHDGHFVTGFSNEQFMKGDCADIPMLFGHTSTEFPTAPRVNTKEELMEYARKYFGEKAGEFLSLCSSRRGSLLEMLNKATVQHLEYSIRTLGRRKAQTGNKTPMYYWVFDPEIPGWDRPGTFHSSDLWFFFETLAKCWRPFTGTHYDLSRVMCNYWANFIRSGDPNGCDCDGSPMPYWKQFSEDEPCRMIFGKTAHAEIQPPSPLMRFLLEEGDAQYR